MKIEARKAVIWSGVDVVFRQGVSFLFIIGLARVLNPEDFGTIALLGFFIGISKVFADAGFSIALIQKQEVTHMDESTIFWFNICAASLIAFLLVLSAEWVSKFYSIEVLEQLLIVSASVVFISSISSVHLALSSKALNFRVQAIIGVASTLISGFLALYLAYQGLGVWALMSQIVASTILTSLLFWVMLPWRPLFSFSRESFESMRNFSSYMFAAQILQTIYSKGYGLLLGKFFGVSALGVYDRADHTQRVISQTTNSIVSKVTFPLYSQYARDATKLRKIVGLSIRFMMFLMAPLMLGIIVVADELFIIIFGINWSSAVPIFQILCLVGMLLPIQSVNVSVLQAQGYAKLNFRLSVIKKIVGISLLVLGCYWGVIGVAWAMLAQSIIALFINAHYSKLLLDYGIVEQVKDCLASVLIAFFVAFVVHEYKVIFELEGPVGVTAMLVIGVLLYLLMSTLFRIDALKEVLKFVKR